MKPLVTTVRALRELATGMSPDAISTSAVLYEHDAPSATFLVAADDEVSEQRIVLLREQNVLEHYVPEQLASHRRAVLGRMASFAERALTRPLSLPRGWSQFKHDNLIAFFAVPNHDDNASRWVAELAAGDRPDVIFWSLTTSDDHMDLNDFASSQRRIPDFDVDWAYALESAARVFDEARRPDSSDVDMYLAPVGQQNQKVRTFDDWLESVSSDQRAFINAPTDRSIRLRGPAGSGKTLALSLKAAKEVLAGREAGNNPRVLIVTHSWSLAAQIADGIDLLGIGPMPELDVFPLLEIAQAVMPRSHQADEGFSLIGEDSYSGKQAQLDEILDVLDDFVSGDWVTYRGKVSESLRARIDSSDDSDRLALAWDLLIEFGSVIGAAAIFPGAGAELKYAQLIRAKWMLPLEAQDLKVVFLLYSKFMANLEERSLLTSDQLLADFLAYLVTHAWNRARRTQGWDLIFVDEFHLFSPLERQVLHYLTRDVDSYPRMFMALDPRQSPSEAFIGLTAADETRSFASAVADEELQNVDSFELTTVHRFTPQILDLIKHVHLSFPTLDLGHDWDVDFSRVESSRDAGDTPRLVVAASRESEENDIYRTVHDLYSRGRIALAVVDMQQWRRFSDLASQIQQSGKFHVSAISGRSDIEGLGYRRRGLVVGSAEYLAGLQFETVLVAGLPDMRPGASRPTQESRVLSLLYLALSRAEREVRVFVNDEDGGAADVLGQAAAKGLMTRELGGQT
jgi:hypothetical protein